MNKKFLIGFFLGDFLHALYVVKDLSGNKKCDIYLTGTVERAQVTFSRGVENVYKDIYPIIKSQPYIDNFYLYDHNNPIEDIIDLRQFLYDYSIIFKLNFYDTFKKLFNTSTKYQYEQWLYGINDNNYDNYKDKIVINFSAARYDDNFDKILENILLNNECVFIASPGDLTGYENFKYNNLLEVKECDSFSEMYSIIEKCKFFIGNQSMPAAVAHGLFKPHLVFLYRDDAVHYKDDMNKNYFWFDNKKRTSKNFSKLNNFIDIDKMEIVPIKPDYSSLIFNVSYDINTNFVKVYCNSQIDVSVFVFEYVFSDVVIVHHDRILNWNRIEFNNDIHSLGTLRPLEDMEYIKVDIKDDEVFLKEEIIKIMKPLYFNITYTVEDNRVYISCNLKSEVFVYIFDYYDTENKQVISFNSCSFDKNLFWFEPMIPLKNINTIKVEIKDTSDTILKEEIIKIIKK